MEKSRIKIISNRWNNNTSILTHIDSLCSNIHFPTTVKQYQYYRPQLHHNPNFEDSFLISSMDFCKENIPPQFTKINENLDYNSLPMPIENYQQKNKINIIQDSKKHSSITFASIFRNNSWATLNSNVINIRIPNNENDEKRDEENRIKDNEYNDDKAQYPHKIPSSIYIYILCYFE